LLQSIIAYPVAQAQFASIPAITRLGMSSGLYILTVATSIGITLLLWWLVAYRASNIAKWILMVPTAIGVLGTLANPGVHRMLFAISLVHSAFGITAAIFLFRSDARDWLVSKGKIVRVDPDVFS
jgi:hypothetical protein